MPTINVNRRELDRLIGKRLSSKELADRISYLGTDVDKVDDDEVIVEIFPNRPDMLSVQGLGRALSSFIGVKTGLRKYDVKSSGEKVIIDSSLKHIRPYTACAIVKGIKFDDEKIKEVIDLQEKLHITHGRNRKKLAIGIYPFEKIKPPIRFLAKKPEEIVFQPLEFFRKMNARQILSQHPTGRAYGHLLEGYEKYPVFVDSNNNVLSMPPIINSHDVGKITESTKDVFIECSGFDFNILKKTLNMIVAALADMGGSIYSMELVYGDDKIITPNLEPEKMEISLNYVKKIIGIDITEDMLKKLLEKMGYSYDEKEKKALVPAYRVDVLHERDIVEDIAIAYGYENIIPEIPKVATISSEDKLEVIKSKIAYIAAGLGLVETNTYNIINKEVQTKKMLLNADVVELRNSVSQEFNSLRYWVLPSLMDILKDNKHNEFPQNIFGIGTVFIKNPDEETGVSEKTRLGVLLCNEKSDYTSIKQVLEYILSQLGLECKTVEAEHNSFIAGRCARVVVKGKKIGYIGEIRPEVLENFSLTMPVSGLELNISELLHLM